MAFAPLCLLLLALCPLVRGLINLLPQLELISFEMEVHEEEKKTWAQAQAYCRTHHLDLFRVTDLLDVRKVQAMRGWIGLYRGDEQSEWTWSGAEELPLDGDYEIEEMGGNCIRTRRGDGSFKASDCSERHSFTCSDEKMVLVRENKTWEEAVHHCRSLGGWDRQNPASSRRNLSYDLVSLADDDLDIALQTAEEAATDEVWIGLRFLAGYWWWVNGKPVKRDGLQSCPADGACGVLEKSHFQAYGSRNCTERRNFLCHMRPQTGRGN
ncbi:unnamed protein product [Ophioblennius macclurei]